jgi:hypothetical protein
MFDADKIEQTLENYENKKVKFTKAYVSDVEGNKYTSRLPKYSKIKN